MVNGHRNDENKLRDCHVDLGILFVRNRAYNHGGADLSVRIVVEEQEEREEEKKANECDLKRRHSFTRK